MKKNLHHHKPMYRLFNLLVISLFFLPLTALASNTPTLVDEVEVVRKNQQLFLYLHSNATVVHQSLETSENHLTIELEQITLSPTVRTSYLNAPNVDSIIVKQLPNHKVRLEVDGTDLNEPIIGFRELSGKAIPTLERIGRITLQKPNLRTAQPVPQALQTAIKTPLPLEQTNPPLSIDATPVVKPSITKTPATVTLLKPQATVTPATVAQKAPLATLPAVDYTATLVEESGNETEESSTPASSSWEALLLRLLVGASHHLDWCVYGLLGTVAFSLLASWGLKLKQTQAINNPPELLRTTNTTAPTVPQNKPPFTVEQKRAALKEVLPPKHQRILDRVQRQMEGTIPGIPAQNLALQAEYKSTPKMPVSQASRQYQQQQSFGNTPPTKNPSKVAETTSTIAFNKQGERINQKVVRPWQPEQLGNQQAEETSSPSANTPPSSGEAFLESINAYLDPASKKNIQQGLRNNKQGL